jgi:EpsD family peptidyl-prolyl cis-trans isomerase
MSRSFECARVGLRRHVALAAAALALLAGCGDAGKGAVATQVAARINKGEISVHQVEQALQRQPRLMQEQPEAAARKVLDALVEQELAAQAARAERLDQDPAVVQALQLAQREVLARAYQDRLASKAVGPTSDEIDRFYESQPALFKQRRLYVLQETAVEAQGGLAEEVANLARKAASAGELAEQLRARSLRFESRQFVQAAEDVPFGMLGPLSQLSPGQSIAIVQPAAVRIFTVLQAQPAPVDRRRATEAITVYLNAERRRAAVAEGMRALRQTAQIEFQGSFAKPASGVAAPATAASRTN